MPLLICCRRIATFCVAAQCVVAHRWIPFKFNAADAGSRIWETPDQGASSRTCKRIQEAVCYPSSETKGIQAAARQFFGRRAGQLEEDHPGSQSQGCTNQERAAQSPARLSRECQSLKQTEASTSRWSASSRRQQRSPHARRSTSTSGTSRTMKLPLRKPQKVDSALLGFLNQAFLERRILAQTDLIASPSLGQTWALNLHPSDDLQESKVEANNETIMMDNQEVPWLGVALSCLQSIPDAPLLPTSYAQVTSAGTKHSPSSNSCNGYAMLYQLRRSGASWDQFKKYCTTLEVKLRGRWACDYLEKLETALKARALAAPASLKAKVLAACNLRRTALQRDGITSSKSSQAVLAFLKHAITPTSTRRHGTSSMAKSATSSTRKPLTSSRAESCRRSLMPFISGFPAQVGAEQDETTIWVQDLFGMMTDSCLAS